jgi:hypothetical protein
MVRTVSSFEFDLGFRLSADTYLSDTDNPFRERRITWYHDYYNRILVRYELDIELLTCICIVNEQWLLFDAVDVEMSEWDGSDGKWHTLTIQVVADTLRVFKDEESVFEYTDSLIGHMPRTGFVELANKSATTCFDNVLLESIERDQFVCGDADGSAAVDIDDAVYLIDHIFVGGSPPEPLEAGDANCSGSVDIDDIVYLVSFIFAGGNPPCDTDSDGTPDC